jgi:hypothetical protein
MSTVSSVLLVTGVTSVCSQTLTACVYVMRRSSMDRSSDLYAAATCHIRFKIVWIVCGLLCIAVSVSGLT